MENSEAPAVDSSSTSPSARASSTSPSFSSRAKVAEAILRAHKSKRSQHSIYRLFQGLFGSYKLTIGISLSIVVLAVATVYLYPDRQASEIPVNDELLIDHINNQSKDFRAKASEFFTEWTIGDTKSTLGGTFWTQDSQFLPVCTSAGSTVPLEFDVRQQWRPCYQQHVVDEVGRCAGSWALTAAASLSERFCIMDHSLAGTRLSAQELLSCDTMHGGCKGGSVDRAPVYLVGRGLVSEECFPYRGLSKEMVSCDEKCTTNMPMRAATYCRAVGEKAVMSEVFTNGPAVGVVLLHDDFLVYSSGIYSPLKTAKRLTDTSRNMLLHGVKIMGWGVEDGKPYWLLENNFGRGWGEEGFAKVRRGAGDSILLVDGVTMGVTPDLQSLDVGLASTVNGRRRGGGREGGEEGRGDASGEKSTTSEAAKTEKGSRKEAEVDAAEEDFDFDLNEEDES